jgi:TolA-binding protein
MPAPTTDDAAPSSPAAAPDIIPIPEMCPGCGGEWTVDGTCPRCGLSRADALFLLTAACTAFREARAYTQQGRFTEARLRLADATANGLLLNHPAVQRLRELLDRLSATSLSEDARTAYQEARHLSERGNTAGALFAAEQAASLAPDALPVQKLYLLCLAAAGRHADAERLRSELSALFPADVDLARYALLSQPPVAPVPVRRRVPAPARPPRRRPSASLAPAPKLALPVWLPVAAVTGLGLGAAALGVALTVALRPVPTSAPPLPTALASPASTPSPQPTPVPVTAAPQKKAESELPADLNRLYNDTNSELAEQQARLWFNQAVKAQKARRYSEAERLADAAYRVGKKTYLAEDALLLLAQAADNRDNPQSAVHYARLASEWPRSQYAPIALQLAARAAKRHGQLEAAASYLRRLKETYPTSPEARRVGHSSMP